MGIPGAEEEIRNENINTKLFEDDPNEQIQNAKISTEEHAATNLTTVTQKKEKIHSKADDDDSDDEEFKEMIIPEEEYNPENYIRVLQPK